MSVDLRVLVLDPDPELYVRALNEQFSNKRQKREAWTLSIQTCRSYARLPKMLSEFLPNVLLASKFSKDPFPRDIIIDTTSIEWIQCTSAGVDHLLRQRGESNDTRLNGRIYVTRASGVHDDVLSDYVICAVLVSNLKFRQFFFQQQQRTWQPCELTPSRGQKMVVLGLGSIGQAIASKAKSLGLDVIGVRRTLRNPVLSNFGLRHDFEELKVVGVEQLIEVLRDADFLVIALPKTPATLGIVSSEVLSSMKPESVVVNISRGGIVDERALVELLERRKLAGAVLDVFETAPLSPNRVFWELPNVIVTPHTGDTVGWREKVASLFCANIRRFSKDEMLENLVDVSRGY